MTDLDILRELYREHQDVFSSLDDSDPSRPLLVLRERPSSWMALHRSSEGSARVLRVYGSQGPEAISSVYETFDRIMSGAAEAAIIGTF